MPGRRSGRSPSSLARRVVDAASRWWGDPARLPSRMNRHGVRPGRFHVHLSSAPTSFLVGGLDAADARVPLPADAGASLGPGSAHQRQTRRGGGRNMLPRANSARGKRTGSSRHWGDTACDSAAPSAGRSRAQRGSNMAPLACSTNMNDAMDSNLATSTSPLLSQEAAPSSQNEPVRVCSGRFHGHRSSPPTGFLVRSEF